jgi:hypothetical protein
MKAILKRFALLMSVVISAAFFSCEGLTYKKDDTANEPSKASKKRVEKMYDKALDSSRTEGRYDNR